MKSSLLNMFLSLTSICVVSGAILATVNELTKEPIALSKKAKLENAIREVVPEFDNAPAQEMYKVGVAANDTAFVYPAKKGDTLVGVAVETRTMNGFSGEIKVLTGLDPNGAIINYAVLSHAETPGLGDKMGSWFKTEKNKQSIIGKDLSKGTLLISKDGGEVDAITASTITSRAFLQAVNKAYVAVSDQTDGTTDATSDATTGATNNTETDAESSATH